MCISRTSKIRILCYIGELMNEVFLIGKVIKEIEYRFMLEKGKNAKAEIKLELLDKTQLKVIAYNEEADYTIQNIRENDIVFIYGMIKETEVIIKNIHII